LYFTSRQGLIVVLLCELRENEGKGCFKYQDEAVKQSGSDLAASLAAKNMENKVSGPH